MLITRKKKYPKFLENEYLEGETELQNNVSTKDK